MPLGELQRSCVAIVVCDYRRLEDDSAADDVHASRARASRGAGRHRRCSPADLRASETDLQRGCWGHDRCRSRDGNRGRQNCDGSRAQNADRLLIRPASGAPGRHRTSDRTNHWKDARAHAVIPQSSHEQRAPTPTWQTPQTGRRHTHSSAMHSEHCERAQFDLTAARCARAIRHWPRPCSTSGRR